MMRGLIFLYHQLLQVALADRFHSVGSPLIAVVAMSLLQCSKGKAFKFHEFKCF
jgi:hypothetical protein